MSTYSPTIPNTMANSAARRGVAANAAVARETPIYLEILPWILFWPLLTLIAKQVVYFSGPARSAEDFQNGAAMGGGGESHYATYVYLLFMLGFVLVGYRRILDVLKKNPMIYTMLAFIVCSALWSTSPRISLQMCVQVGICTCFACYLSNRYSPERLMQVLVFMGVCSALLSYVFAIALPSYGIFQGYGTDAWQGICKHKNALGVSMAYMLSPIFFTSAYSRVQKIGYSLLLLILVYKCQSRGAWADTLGMLCFVAWLALARRIRNREFGLVVVTTASIAIIVVVLAIQFWPTLALSMGKDATMTGRTGIYREVWSSILKRPLLGYGFGAFWATGSSEAERIRLALSWPNIGYAESGILDMALQIGFVGVGLVVVMIARALVHGSMMIRSLQYSPKIGWYLSILVLAVLTNIDAGWFLTSDAIDWVLILVACIGINKEMSSSPKAVVGAA